MGQKMSDIILSIIDEFKARVPELAVEVTRDIEISIRKQWGGEQAYIAKRCELVDSKRQTINSGLRAGHSIAQIEQLHGIPRSTIYRLINHKQRG
jgi:Mor family transcriptional regulator